MIRLALRVSRADAELALAELLELASGGVEEVDLGPRGIEYAIYGAPGELPELPALRAAAGRALVEVSTSELADDWAERWREFHRPVLVPSPAAGVPALHVRPPWEPPSGRADAEEIVIDPGQAFGTGAHATTRLCLELLLELAAREPARGALVDVGCGSGVLAIAAARLGWAPVLALDHERESVAASAENARVNGVTVEVRRADLRREPPPSTPTLLANLLRPLLLDLSSSLAETPRRVIASGLLRGQVDEVSGAFAQRLGLVERERRAEGEWAAVLLERPGEQP